MYWVSQKKVTRLMARGKSMRPEVKTELLIYKSKENLGVNILFGNISLIICFVCFVFNLF